MTWREHVNRLNDRIEDLSNGPITGPQATRNVQSLQQALAIAQAELPGIAGTPGHARVLQRVNAARAALARHSLAAKESWLPWGKVLLGAAGVAVVGGIIYVVLAD